MAKFNRKRTQIERVVSTGPMAKLAAEMLWLRSHGYRITYSNPQIRGHRIDSTRFKVIAEKASDAVQKG